MAFLVVIFVCYFITNLIKKTPIQNEWLPLISGGSGVLLATIAFFAIPTALPVNNLGTAIVYGFFLGLAATGSNQVFKQAVKYIVNKFNVVLPLTDDKEDGDK